MRRLVARDLGEPEPELKDKPQQKPDISIIFDLIKDGPATDIARDKDKLGEAVWANYLRKVARGRHASAGERLR